MKKKTNYLFLLFFICLNAFALDLQVTPTNETCTGNGSLSFTVTNQTAGVPVFYAIYLLPNTTTPIATVSTNSFGGLVAGNYLVIASQTVGSTTTTAQQNATVINQIIPLTFSITGTNVLCGNDGTITVAASATAFSYQILAGPVTTGVQSSNFFTGLPAGIYNIRVVDNCGDGIVQAFTLLSTTTSLNIFAPNLLQILSCNSISVSHGFSSGSAAQIAYPLNVQTTVFPPTGPPIVSSQIITSGMSFNLTIPSQSNQSYPYNVLVTDACGNTYSLNNNQLSFTPIEILPGELDEILSVNTLYVTHEINLNQSYTFLYPITVQATIYPSSGPPTVVYQTITSGTVFSLTIPFENNVSYTYDLLITDACGNSYTLSNNIIEINPALILDIGDAECNDYFITLKFEDILAPYYINFISSPIGFNPLNYNSNYPGPYTQFEIIFGGLNNSLPLGTYIIEVVDSLGNIIQRTFTIEDIQNYIVEDVITTSGCGGTGSVLMTFDPTMNIGSVSIYGAPASYPNSLPDNVSTYINPSALFFMDDLPLGNYIFHLTDACGNLYIHEVALVPEAQDIYLEHKPGCETGMTSIVISVEDSIITFIEILEAPSTFSASLPLNITFNVATNGALYMNSLPEGFYKFRIVDNCGYDRIFEKTIVGLDIGNTIIDIAENCGSFNLQLEHNSNGNHISSFWLQKYNETTGVWEHPSTGFDYIPGSNLTATNAVKLYNHTNNINLAYAGLFRIVKVFYNYSNGIANLNRCIVVLNEFEFKGGPKIIDAYAFPCVNNTLEVVVIAEGLAPLQYSITEKNGLPFVVSNGISNTFSGLEPAIYNFRVEDVCGNFVNRDFDVSILNEPEIIPLDLCDGVVGQLEIQNFPFVTYQWYNIQNPSVILSTTNYLQFSPFNSLTDEGTYAVQLSSSSPNSCINQVIEYNINADDFNPNAGNDESVELCKEDLNIGLNTFLSNPHDDGGVWTDSNGLIISGMINPSQYDSGVYQFTYTVNGLCLSSDFAVISITIKDLPLAPVLSAPSPICRGEEIQLNATLIQNATYFWTGPNGFTSTEQNPIILDFMAINDGDYFLFVEVDGCNSETQQIALNSYPIPEFSIEGVTSLCLGVNENLTINPVNFDISLASISWSYNGIPLIGETNSTLQINQVGIYSVLINYEGCIGEKQVEITENNNAFEVVLEHGCNQREYEINIVNAQDFPNATYAWTGPNGFISFNQNIVVPNLQIGTYNVEVTDVLGCKSNSSVLVEHTNCLISNGFSPDGDGINDSFDLTGFNVKKIYIYNRYGRLVYDKDNYINEWKGQTNDNNKLPASTYFYVLEFYEGENKTGWVYLTY